LLVLIAFSYVYFELVVYVLSFIGNLKVEFKTF